MHPRRAIRAYAYDMLKADVKAIPDDRIYLNRPYNVGVLEFPCMCLYFGDETAQITTGDRYIPQEYERLLGLNVAIMAEQPNDPDDAMRVEDRLDEIGDQVERSLFDDIFFEKRNPEYNAQSRTNEGLLAGLRLNGIRPGELEIGDRVVAVQEITFQLIYKTFAFVTHRSHAFESYLLEIRRVGWDETTVDPVLIAAEGDL